MPVRLDEYSKAVCGLVSSGYGGRISNARAYVDHDNPPYLDVTTNFCNNDVKELHKQVIDYLRAAPKTWSTVEESY